MKLKWLNRDLVISSHYFTLCTTEKLFKAALKHLNIKRSDRPEFVLNWHSDATAHYFDNKSARTKSCVVCVRNFEDKSAAEVFGLLTHEAVHIWQEIKYAYGEHAPGREFEAYSIQNIAQRLFAEFERQTK